TIPSVTFACLRSHGTPSRDPSCCVFLFSYRRSAPPQQLHSFPTRRSSDLRIFIVAGVLGSPGQHQQDIDAPGSFLTSLSQHEERSEEHTSELQSRVDLVCRLLLEKKKTTNMYDSTVRP